MRAANTYRGARRNEARKRRLVWRALDRSIGGGTKKRDTYSGASLAQATTWEFKNRRKPWQGKKPVSNIVFGGSRFGQVTVLMPQENIAAG